MQLVQRIKAIINLTTMLFKQEVYAAAAAHNHHVC
jgi:hypothetical protein